MQKKNKPSILFVIGEMSMGGIPKASIPMMQELLRYADVSLLLARSDGILTHLVPEGVQVIVKRYERTKTVFLRLLQKHKYVKASRFLIGATYLSRVQKRWVKANYYNAQSLGYFFEKEYDCAIAYHGMNIDHLTRTLCNVRAKKKIAWIHGEHPFRGVHLKDVACIYEQFDKIYYVSKVCMQDYLRDFPSLADKSSVFYCLINTMEIREKALERIDFSYPEDSINILTVGRISPEKGQDMLPEIIRCLEAAGHCVRWFLIGDGSDKVRIEKLAKDNNRAELFFLGTKTNPYPYICGCDIYVQPSYSEAYSLTAFEAATLGKAIVLTDVAGATELLVPDENVVVVEPSPKSVAEGILRVLSNPDFKKKLETNSQLEDFSNYGQVKPFVEWICGLDMG